MAGLAGISGAAQTPAPPEHTASIGFAIGNLDPTLQRLYQATVQLEGLVARVFGPHPTPVNTDKSEQEPASLIAKLNMRGRALMTIADRLDELVRQLDQAL